MKLSPTFALDGESQDSLNEGADCARATLGWVVMPSPPGQNAPAASAIASAIAARWILPDMNLTNLASVPFAGLPPHRHHSATPFM